MTSADWPQIETSVGDFSSRFGITPDLFEGDLFGDELMDMYNSSVIVGSGGSDMVESIADIPNVLFNSSGYDNANKTVPNNCYSAQDTLRLRTMDDGPGVFCPSTSYNDFASLLNTSDASAPISMAATLSKLTTSSITSPAPMIPGTDHSAVPVKNLITSKPKKRSRTDHNLASSEAGASPSKKKTLTSPKALNTAKKITNTHAAGNHQSSSIVTPAPDHFAEAVERKQQLLLNDVPEAQDINTDAITQAVVLKLHNNSRLEKQEGCVRAQVAKDTPNPLDLHIPEKRCTMTDSVLSVNVGSVVTPPTASKAGTALNATCSLPSLPTLSSTVVLSADAPRITVDSTQHRRYVAALQAAVAVVTTSEKASVPLSARSHLTDAATAVDFSSFVPGEPATEESFKELAQAAVTNLILKAGGAAGKLDLLNMSDVTDDDSDCGGYYKGPVDTSTDHVTALTSSNWVAACSASVSGAPPGTAAATQAAALVAANDPAASKAARVHRATLSPDERARQNRDRNREHARNTRLRKKAYVEELKRTLTELVSLRDAAELERRHEAQRDLEVREVRFRVMEEYLKLRARGDEPGLLSRWAAILEDGFTLTLPKTEYRTMGGSPRQEAIIHSPSEVTRPIPVDNATIVATSSGQIAGPFEHMLRGASESMDDAARLSSFVNSLDGGKNVVHMTHHCERKTFLMDGVNTVLEYSLTTTGAVNQEAASEFVIKGSMRATFSPASNKLARAELLFDTGSVASQLKSLVLQTSVRNDWHVCSPLSEFGIGDATAAAGAANEANALIGSIRTH